MIWASIQDVWLQKWARKYGCHGFRIYLAWNGLLFRLKKIISQKLHEIGGSLTSFTFQRTSVVWFNLQKLTKNTNMNGDPSHLLAAYFLKRFFRIISIPSKVFFLYLRIAAVSIMKGKRSAFMYIFLISDR